MNSIIIKNISNVNDLTVKGLFEFTNPSGSISFRFKDIPQYNYFYRYINNDIQLFFPDNITDTQLININNIYYQVSQQINEHFYIEIADQSRANLKQLVKAYKAKKQLLSLSSKTANLKYDYCKLCTNKHYFSALAITRTTRIEYLNKENHWVSIDKSNIIYRIKYDTSMTAFILRDNNCIIRSIKTKHDDLWGDHYTISYRYYNNNDITTHRRFCEYANLKKDLYVTPLISEYTNKLSFKPDKEMIVNIPLDIYITNHDH